MKFSRTLFLILFFTNSVLSVFSQFVRPNAWKKCRKEVIIQIGASGFLGDLGGRNLIGTDFSPVDLELACTRPALSFAYRYKLSKLINLHTSFNYLLLSGDDKLTKEIYRNNRNLNFKSNVYELSTRIEFSLSSVKHSRIYSLRRSLNKTNRRMYYEFICFIGVGGFYFNPKGKNQNTGSYVGLYNLHTEGQGLQDGPKQYKRVALSIPIGVAIRTIINKDWAIGIEFNYRKTFTDYIDDVSTSYYDKSLLNQSYGSESGLMADQSKGDINGASLPAADGTRAQRGDKNKDSFMSIQITIGRFISTKRGKRKIRAKF